MYTYHIAQKPLAAWVADEDRMRRLLARDNGFPAKHVMATIDGVPKMALHHDRVHTILRKIRKIISRGIGLIISGPKGAGKTSIACLSAVAAARYGVEAHFILADDAVRLMQSRYMQDPIVDVIRRVHLLVLDDITEGIVDARELETLIRHRTSNDLSTFITTNIPISAFKQKNAMVWDLIAENCLPIEVDPRMRARGVAQMPEDDD